MNDARASKSGKLMGAWILRGVEEQVWSTVQTMRTLVLMRKLNHWRPNNVRLSSIQTKPCVNSNKDGQGFFAFDTKTPVRLRMESEDPGNLAPMLVQTMIRKSVQDVPESFAIAYRDPGSKEWTRVTYKDYYERIQTVAKGFLGLGLGEGKGVGIMAPNSHQWSTASIATIFAGGLTCGIYPTSSAEVVAHVCNNGEVDILVVEDLETLKKAIGGKKSIGEALFSVKTTVLIESTESEMVEGISVYKSYSKNPQKITPLFSWEVWKSHQLERRCYDWKTSQLREWIVGKGKSAGGEQSLHVSLHQWNYRNPKRLMYKILQFWHFKRGNVEPGRLFLEVFFGVLRFSLIFFGIGNWSFKFLKFTKILLQIYKLKICKWSLKCFTTN